MRLLLDLRPDARFLLINRGEHSYIAERLKAAGVPVETLYVRTEGHGFYAEANQRAYYTRLLDFLSRHLGGAKAK